MIYESIGGWFLDDTVDIYRRAVRDAHDGDVFVELGVFRGRSTACMAEYIKNSGKKIKFYAVDTFDFYDGKPDEWRESHGIKWPKGQFTYEDTLKNLEPLKDYVTVLKQNSWEPIPGVNVANWVWVDASHEYEDIKKDLTYWLPRAKIIGGDDYGFEGVRRAIEELCPNAKKGRTWRLNPNPYFREP